MLFGDFNSKIENVHTHYFDSLADPLHMQVLDLPPVFQRYSVDSLLPSGYGRFLLELGET